MSNELSRRAFLKIIAVTSATAAGCRNPAARELIPYVIPDELDDAKAVQHDVYRPLFASTSAHDCVFMSALPFSIWSLSNQPAGSTLSIG